MIRIASFATTLMALASVIQSAAFAGLVITSTAVVDNSAATNATVTVSVFGRPDVGTQALNAFGLKLTIGGIVGTPTFSAPDLTNAGTGSWAPSGVFNRPTPTTTTNSVTFQGYRSIGPGGGGSGNNITIASGDQLIGSFKFTVAKTAVEQTVTITSAFDTALGQLSFQGPVIPVTNDPLTNKGFFVDSGTLDPVPTDLTQIGTGTIAAIVAVPEPSSLALIGVVGVGALLVRHRRVA